ncbi:hypothetical protein VQL36_06315 [Chengkuizengella sp. SCS-71B]|uniref:hypothetical protein n=1 Tax=Chengkuizengella sp. SCS-71B TaxID=3115290 RepID=UPI0032C22045
MKNIRTIGIVTLMVVALALTSYYIFENQKNSYDQTVTSQESPETEISDNPDQNSEVENHQTLSIEEIKDQTCLPAQKLTNNKEDNLLQFLNTPSENAALSGIQSISTNTAHDFEVYGSKEGTSYALDNEGRVFIWGSGINISYPRLMTEFPKVKEMAGGFILSEDNDIWYLNWDWGLRKPVVLPKIVTSLSNIKEMKEVNYSDLYVLTENGKVFLIEGSYGDPSGEEFEMIEVKGLENIEQIYISNDLLFAQKSDGTLWKVSQYTEDDKDQTAVRVIIPEKVVNVSEGVDYAKTFIQLESGNWVSYKHGNDQNEEPIISPLENMSDDLIKIVHNKHGVIALKKDGTVWGWGDENYNLVPDQNQTVEEPIQIQELHNIVDVQMGAHHVLVLNEQGEVYSWGNNMNGQLGRFPLTYDQFRTIGSFNDNIEQIIPVIPSMNRPYSFFVFNKGEVWGITSELDIERFQFNSEIDHMTMFYYDLAVLTKEGNIIFRDFNEECTLLKFNRPIKKINGSLLQIEEGNLYKLILKENGKGFEIKGVNFAKESLQHINLQDIKQLEDFPILMIVTEDGKLFYESEMQGEDMVILKQLEDISPIQEIKTMERAYFHSFFDNDSSEPIGLAIDKDRNVYLLDLNLDNTGKGRIIIKSNMQLDKIVDNISSFTGSLWIKDTGEFQDQLYQEIKYDSVVENPEEIVLAESNYSYFIEGPGLHYHVIVMENGDMKILGDNPFLFYNYTAQIGKVLIE